MDISAEKESRRKRKKKVKHQCSDNIEEDNMEKEKKKEKKERKRPRNDEDSIKTEDKEYNAGIDWWSLGITIYKTATGSHPFLSKFTNAILYKEPCIPKWLNKELQDLLGNIREHSFLHSIDWVKLENLNVPTPSKPIAVPLVDFSKTTEKPLSFLESIKYKMSSRYVTPASQLEQLSHLWTSRKLCHSQAQPMAILSPYHPAPLSAPFGPFGFPVQLYAAYLPHVGFYQQPLPPVPYNLHPFFGPVIRPPPVPPFPMATVSGPLHRPFPSLTVSAVAHSTIFTSCPYHRVLFLALTIGPNIGPFHRPSPLALNIGYCLWLKLYDK
ncbi:hypothetical protein XELAEV_18006650mg [Xenopus laevis]|uniref:Protein kinase domain-containing protein n=1 Tax=Xenopus laevis TaxID=8355 RepID=A0A974E1E9_XENLA|nr:hypothetical protein XELAEV_18006650mg [Xenopus laevis]